MLAQQKSTLPFHQTFETQRDVRALGLANAWFSQGSLEECFEACCRSTDCVLYNFHDQRGCWIGTFKEGEFATRVPDDEGSGWTLGWRATGAGGRKTRVDTSRLSR